MSSCQILLAFSDRPKTWPQYNKKIKEKFCKKLHALFANNLAQIVLNLSYTKNFIYNFDESKMWPQSLGLVFYSSLHILGQNLNLFFI